MDTLQRIEEAAKNLGADKCPPAPHACDMCEILFLCQEAAGEIGKYYVMQRALAAYSAACDLPNNIPEMLSWDARKTATRNAAMIALENCIKPELLRSLHDLTAEMLSEELADE